MGAYIAPRRLTVGLSTALLVSAMGLAVPGMAQQASAPIPASAPGYVRTSQYITMRDGMRLAIDVLRPATMKPGEQLPVVFEATPYQRARLVNGKLVTIGDPENSDPLFRRLLANGYIVASVDMRGRGASFGTVFAGGGDNPLNRWDMYDVVEWLATQPWSDGNIGMVGCSYVGNTVIFAMETAPPHLKAIAPCSTPLDLYRVLRNNGITQTSFLSSWDKRMQYIDTVAPSPTVDEDRDGSLRAAAVKEHLASWSTGLAAFSPARNERQFRDTVYSRPEYYYAPANQYVSLGAFRTTQIPVLSFGGWYDLFPMESTNWFVNIKPFGNQQRLVMGPWWHCEWYRSDLWDTIGDHQRWFDRYLKGIRNGIDTEPPIAYFVINAPKGSEWKRATTWPLPNARLSDLYFGAPAGTGVSLNNGTLIATAPGRGGVDQATADYSISTPDLTNRFHPNVPLKAREAANLNTSKLDAKSLTWTSASYARNTEITGVPRMSLWAASSAPDQDFFVYLSVVHSDGSTTLVTDGGIRASDRKVRIPPYENQGVPWHGTYRNDQQPLVPGQPVKLDFGLHPTSFMVRAGERIRVTVNFHDPEWDTPVLSPAPKVSILRDKAHPSAISLPVVQPHH